MVESGDTLSVLMYVGSCVCGEWSILVLGSCFCICVCKHRILNFEIIISLYPDLGEKMILSAEELQKIPDIVACIPPNYYRQTPTSLAEGCTGKTHMARFSDSYFKKENKLSLSRVILVSVLSSFVGFPNKSFIHHRP